MNRKFWPLSGDYDLQFKIGLPDNRKQDCHIHHSHQDNLLRRGNLKKDNLNMSLRRAVLVFIFWSVSTCSEFTYRLGIRYFLWNIGSHRHYHHWDNSKRTQLNCFRNDPYKPHLNQVPWKHFQKCNLGISILETPLNKFKNLQTLGEWIKTFWLTRDQGKDEYQKGESHFWNSRKHCAIL